MSTAKANQKHWTENAKEYRKVPGADRIFAQVTHNLQSQVDWLQLSKADKQSTRIIDYACGPGAASQALADYADLIVGIDSAAGMVSEYNDQVATLKLDKSKMYAIQADLLSNETIPEHITALYGTIDLLVVSLGFHHFDNPTQVISKLMQPLKKGGRLVIIDFLSHNNFDDPESAPKATIGHGGQKGFSEEEMITCFKDAGCPAELRKWDEQIEFKSKGNGKEMKFDVFTCRGIKA